MNNLNKINGLGIGRRKSAIAKVQLVPGTGEIKINQKEALNYLQLNVNYLNICKSPLQLLGLSEVYDVFAKVEGGGLTGQAEAIRLGVARALCQLENQNKSSLKNAKFLTRDSRVKERKKYGLKKARKASQYSKR
jgi:small subunit ribosomal protein S9